MDRKELLDYLMPYIERAGYPIPANLKDLSVDQLTTVLEGFVKDPYFLDGMSRSELEDLLEELEDELDCLHCNEPEDDDDDEYEEWEEEVDELEDKIESVKARLGISDED